MDTSEQYIKMCREAFTEDAEDGDELKTQDQLQEMVEAINIGVKLAAFTHWVSYQVMGRQGFSSFEQFWLAFVMKEKYNKTWNGEAWV